MHQFTLELECELSCVPEKGASPIQPRIKSLAPKSQGQRSHHNDGASFDVQFSPLHNEESVAPIIIGFQRTETWRLQTPPTTLEDAK